ncbi:MAG: DUF1028 domain-containing protein [Rubrivivax sp.]
MTFSVVAHCRESGQFGVAIATYSPNVGARCPLVVPGRGAAAVQAVANPELMQQARALIAQGLSAEKVIAELAAGDPYPEHRQLAVIDVYGRAAARTGQRNPAWCGHRVGEGVVCAGNVLAGPQVVDAMLAAFEADATLPLAERLVRAVEAGRDAGGQPEGQNSAALLLVDHWPYPLADLRVDLHDQPEAELRRLWDWWAPMVPYYARRAVDATVPRWWQWREEHVPGWIARHRRNT